MLRRALALALQPHARSPTRTSRTACDSPSPWTRRSGRRARLRAFLLADLRPLPRRPARHRPRLLGAAPGSSGGRVPTRAPTTSPPCGPCAAARRPARRCCGAAGPWPSSTLRARLAPAAHVHRVPAARSRLPSPPGGCRDAEGPAEPGPTGGLRAGRKGRLRPSSLARRKPARGGFTAAPQAGAGARTALSNSGQWASYSGRMDYVSALCPRW